MTTHDKGKTPSDLLAELKDMVTAMEKDADKASRGMKAGGVRLRAELQTIKDKANAIRQAVLEWRRPVKKREGQATAEDAPVPEVVAEPVLETAAASASSEQSNYPFWYNSVGY